MHQIQWFPAATPSGILSPAAFRRLLDNGLPGAKDEDWRYTSLESIARSRHTVSEQSGVRSGGDIDALLERWLAGSSAQIECSRLVFVDGFFQQELSDSLPDGLTLRVVERPDSADWNSTIPDLNAAIAKSSIEIVADRNITVGSLIKFAFFSSGSELISAPRVSLKLADNSQCEILEEWSGVGSYTVVPVFDIDVGPGAGLTHTKIQTEALAGNHLAFTRVIQSRGSRYTSNVFHFGGKLVRNEIHPIISGEGVECYLNGLSAVSGDQHVDNFTVIDHAKPNSFSREIYKGVYNQRSSGAFCGTIIVREDAQKTNAIQSNKSILLSDQARINSKPQLKIWADDVKCTHGATVGQLDEHALFYLRSRGIPVAAAKEMLIRAFASEVVAQVSNDEIRGSLEVALAARLAD